VRGVVTGVLLGCVAVFGLKAGAGEAQTQADQLRAGLDSFTGTMETWPATD
jgi:hypothetical protein